MPLVAPLDLALPSATQHLTSKVNLEIAADDGMYQGNDRHYLSCGASALNVIMAALHLAGASDPATLLDFGAGAGRVTRWLRAAFPSAAIDACDLREQDMEFCRKQFDARTWISGVSINSLRAPGTYDLIWLGSVATHLSPGNTISMFEKMLSWTNVGGLVIMSFHGRLALRRQNSGEFRYIHDAGWDGIKAGYADAGYGYSDYEAQSGYGISVTKLSWIAGLIEGRTDASLVALSEAAWDGHHDVVAVQAVTV
jgi:hypothetical protein